jgi:hypothetical protein
MVSFERVFEVIDLPVEIDDKPDAKVLTGCAARWCLRMSPSSMMLGQQNLLQPGQTPGPDG